MIKCMAYDYLLFDNSPATRFGESFPIGNGLIGGMISGTTPVNKVSLSGNTFFSGAPALDNCQKDAAHFFYKMRRSALKNDFKQVHTLAEGFVGKKNEYGTNLPIGNITLKYGSYDSKVTLVSRSLCIMTGIASRKIEVKCPLQENSFIQEEIFASNPRNCMVMTAQGNNRFDLEIGLEELTQGEINRIVVAETEAVIEFKASAYEEIHCEKKSGVNLAGSLSILSDGMLTSNEKGILIKDCTWMHSYLKMETDYLEKIGRNDKDRLVKKEKMSKRSLPSIRREHIEDIGQLLRKNILMIEDQPEICFLYQYGRYLLISSVRKNSVLPPHLQGIWNDNVACRIGWTCDMHLDINTQMNYWPALITGLEETIQPLLFWIEKVLLPEGRKTAAMCYGIPGWAGEIVSNAWGYAAPYWASPIAPCPTGGIWILTHLWEYYLYTGDLALLYKKIYPVYKEAVAFFKEYIFLDEKGNYLSGPSISPENSFQVERDSYQISVAPTYEILMIRELFDQYCKMLVLLFEEDYLVTNASLEEEYHIAQIIRDHMLPYRISEDGTLSEYWHDFEIPDRQHRHTSHLLGVFPFAQITPEETPKLVKAAQKTIQSKLIPIQGWENTGWASSLLALYEARFYQGNQALTHLKTMMQSLKEPNYMIFHPPTRGADAFDHVYELDGNTGFTSCVAEMLLQSHKGILHILPALPEEWEAGYVTGLQARGRITVDISWKQGRAQEVSFYSDKNQMVSVKIADTTLKIQLNAKEKLKLITPFVCVEK